MTALNTVRWSRRAQFLTLPERLLLLTVSVLLCLVLNAAGAGAQTNDDHGNTFASATPLSLGSSIAGRIDPGNDVDVFKLDLSSRSGPTDIWIYTTGELDTVGGLYDIDPRNPFLQNDDSFISGRRLNFHLRATLAPGIYYVGVFSFDRIATGDYVLHAEVVTDPGNTIGTAKALTLRTPTAGTIGFPGDNDYFRLDLTRATHLYLYARSVYGERFVGYPVDTGDRFIPSNTHIRSDGFFVRDQFSPGTYFIKVFTRSDVTSHPVHYTIHAFEEASYPEFLRNCQAATSALNNPQISDSLYGCQWHLNNALGEDINIEPVWAEGIKGEGVSIAVVDDGMDFGHVDLSDNVNTSLNHNYRDSGSVFHPLLHHGTNVAGIIAARDNGVGVRGVAPRASIYGYNYLASDRTDAQRSDAMTRNAGTTAVSNNSWGFRRGPGLSSVSAIWEMAIEYGVRTGYNGKGTFYAFAGGNGHPMGDNSNLSEIANYYGVTSVCAVNDSDIRTSYSELGANLWVCAPSGEISLVENREIITTENYDRYVDSFSGTSAATPIVSGVAALMRQANPNLTWRDLKLILATSARKNDPANAGWEDGARKYGSASPTDRYHFNHEYGFGVVDAKAAVDMARGWGGNLPTLQSGGVASGSFDFLVPDVPATGIPTTHYHELSLNSDIDFTEFVEVSVTFNHPSFRDLDIELVSPSGTVSKLTVPFNTVTPEDPTDDDLVSLHGTFRFGSARHLGENPTGVWQLRVGDHIPFLNGMWNSWSIKVYGHRGTPASARSCVSGGAVADAVQNPGLVSDCETLLETRDILVGTGTPLNWSAGTPISRWDGVTVSGTPARVTEVTLRNKGLRGTIPAQLGNLPSLSVLDLITPTCDGGPCPGVQDHERNRLTGTIPASLGNLSGLRDLLLHNNELTGVIPSALGRLSNLQVLALGLNQLSGTIPTELGSLNRLSELYLWGNQLTGTIPSQLGNLSALEQLQLSQNQLTGQIPTTLENLTTLETLYLNRNQLSGEIPNVLGNMIALEELYLNDNQLTGQVPASFGSLSNLEELWLSQNQLSGEIPLSLGDLSNLRELSLWGNQLTGMIPISLVRLTSLETLYLSQNQLSGCIPSALQSVAVNDLADLGLPYCGSTSVTLSSASAGAPVRIDTPIPVTATFSGPVSGFTVSDVTVANGSASNFVGSDGDSVFTFDVTPNAIGTVTVDIPADAAADAEGNGNTAAAQLSLGLPYDDDRDGKISLPEAINAVSDYFTGVIAIERAIAVVQLYFLSGL